MITVTVANDELYDPLVANPVDGVRVVRWDLRAPLPVPVDEVDVVVIPHYFVRADGFAVLHDLPNLSVVQLPSAGFEYAVDLVPPAAALCNGRGVHDAGTAELAVGMLLAVQRGIDESARAMTEHRWAPVFRSSLADRRVMVLGYGAVGAAIARRLDAFEVDVVPVATTARDEDGRHVHGMDELASLLPTVDAVVLIVPLTPGTAGLVDADFLAALPDGALVVNMARGKVVDTDALLAELRSGRLRAALDVTDPEPLPDDHPLWDAPNLLVTPHVGGYTNATHPRFEALVRRQLETLVAGGAPLNVVRPAR
ncbi:2-hydroxyacid dehydrogenase [Actinotalea sp. M2MS4P-6]|uniref:2-hydroxyacid dehydrogenase n=1 Tax=Actinotalea sp. M2MS4P-6 TaxID=2983762 RepID=UPI0021E467C5|nr:2-hydroxyacid dehydrogenase [Actinotalea sp. M2MS4P-6]MCV2394043.1 2-hydroxyacid dehydrogenase [Actinotalea sp. M2MS4P-6]